MENKNERRTFPRAAYRYLRLLKKEKELGNISEDFEAQLIASADFKHIRDYSLVLSSQSIPHRVTHSKEGPFEIYTTPDFLEQANEQIELFQKENPPREHNAPLPIRLSLQPLWVLSIPIFFTLIQFSKNGNILTQTGIADADKILSGEWWRIFTALSLHGNAKHLISNLVSGYFILNLLAYRIPLSRLAPLILIFSGIANACVSFTVGSDFRSLGFSTFVFTALGCLGSLEFRLMPKEAHGLLRRFSPWIGAACLAVFLGIGENADVLAHFYGFLAGILSGMLPDKKSLHWGHAPGFKGLFFIFIYFAVFIICWFLAIQGVYNG